VNFGSNKRPRGSLKHLGTCEINCTAKEGESMCPHMKGMICRMVDVEPEHLDCVRGENCLGDGWKSCGVYISQFFFDKNDELI
jgi:hypothetical protein